MRVGRVVWMCLGVLAACSGGESASPPAIDLAGAVGLHSFVTHLVFTAIGLGGSVVSPGLDDVRLEEVPDCE